MAARNCAIGDPKLERALPNLVSRLAKHAPGHVLASGSRPSTTGSSGSGLGSPIRGSPGQRRRPGTGGLGPGMRSSSAAGGPRGDAESSAPLNFFQGGGWERALGHVCSVAEGVSEDLGEVIAGWDEASALHTKERSALRGIMLTAQAVCTGLDEVAGIRTLSGSSATPSKSAKAVEAVKPYDDPILSRAKKLSAMTLDLCKEVESTSNNFGLDTQKSIEAESLNEIVMASRRACEEMARFQAEQRGLRSTSEAGEDPQQDEGTQLGEGSPRDPGLALTATLSEAGIDLPDSPVAAGEGSAGGVDSLSAAAEARQRLMDTQIPGIRDLQSVLAQRDDELSEEDVSKIRHAFRRFKVPDTNDLFVEDVGGLLAYMGHVMLAEEGIKSIVNEVTTYDYLDFEEFLSMMEKFIAYEKEEFRIVFQNFDDDGSGAMDPSELKPLLAHLGLIPLRAMITEALSIVDQDGNGELDFDEFVSFLKVYRRAEGFTTAEALELRGIFDFFSAHGGGAPDELPADQLSDSLVQSFGSHVSDMAQGFEAQLMSGQGLTKSSLATTISNTGRPEGISFAEFLIFARRTREAAMEKFKGDYKVFSGRRGEDDMIEVCASGGFESADKDGSGSITEAELRIWLKQCGYTPLKQNIEEIFAEVDKDGSSELDFNEFFDFILIFLQREGFRKSVVADFRKTFDRFDEDGSGEISALELADLFRDLGYSATLDELHAFVSQVDANGSNQLDFREYLRLMRLYREEELRKIELVFENFSEPATGLLHQLKVKEALKALNNECPKSVLKKQKDLSFDDFVKLADSCRTDRVARERKLAGFSEERIMELEEAYNRFDKDKSGEIDTMELMGILTEFGWQPKTREEQSALVKKLDRARAKARYAGIKEVGPDGSVVIKFWTFVQLCRLLETEQEVAEEARTNALMKELKFTIKEVEEFRKIFLDKRREYAEECGSTCDAFEGLPRDAVLRLMRMLDVSVKAERKVILDKELNDLGCPSDGFLDFAGFLRLMRWLIGSGWLGGGS